MKLKQGLGIVALVAGLSSCSDRLNNVNYPTTPEVPVIKNISTDIIRPMAEAEEKYVVNTTYFPSCPQAEVTMNAYGYYIGCDHLNYFIHRNGSDSLSWGSNVYFDDGHDGNLDQMSVDGVLYLEERIEPAQNEWYTETIKNLGKEIVHNLWKARWRPYGSE
ncbi:MAG: hypothetical protein AABY40_00190 [Nanoarchaeota archaeon]